MDFERAGILAVEEERMREGNVAKSTWDANLMRVVVISCGARQPPLR